MNTAITKTLNMLEQLVAIPLGTIFIILISEQLLLLIGATVTTLVVFSLSYAISLLFAKVFPNP